MKGKCNVEERIRKCQWAFFSLQGIGFCKGGVNLDVKVHLWNSICTPVIHAINVPKLVMSLNAFSWTFCCNFLVITPHLVYFTHI